LIIVILRFSKKENVLNNSTAKAIAAIGVAIAVSVAIYVTKDGGYLWGIIAIPLIWYWS